MSEEKENPGVLRSFARRIRKATDPEDEGLLASVLETGDKAKTEIVRLLAKEFRAYIEALDIGKDIKHILTNYSLEFKASVHLKELIPKEESSNTASSKDEPKSE